ncbi:MAG: hypothetical protein GC162_06225 [Planctomycetes bacterium]|nr:hypothetical protein [Planctomycetota bacterium]
MDRRLRFACLTLLLFALPVHTRAADEVPPQVDADTGVEIEWNSINSSATFDLKDGSVDNQMSLNGQITFPAQRRYAAYIIELTQITDAAGESVMRSKPTRWSGRSEGYNVNRIMAPADGSGAQGIGVDLSRLVTDTSRVAKIRGVIYLLEVTGTHETDILLAPSATMTPLAPGIKVRVDHIEKQDPNSFLNVAYQYVREGNLSIDALDRPPFLYAITGLDAQSKPVPLRAPPYNYVTGNGTGMVRFYPTDEKSAPIQMRIILATETTERRVSFELDVAKLTKDADAPPVKPR